MYSVSAPWIFTSAGPKPMLKVRTVIPDQRATRKWPSSWMMINRLNPKIAINSWVLVMGVLQARRGAL